MMRPIGWSIGANAVAFGLGGLSAVSAFLLGTPANGAFVAVRWVAALAAVLIAGWPRFGAFLVGLVVCAVALDLSDGVFGLVLLIVAVLSAIAAHGAISAWTVLRIRSVGPHAAVRDRAVLAGAGVTLGLAVLFAWFAIELGRNPA